MATEQKNYRVVRLQASNIKRLKAIDFCPDRNIVGIGGENDQGKTTVLDAIQWALAGKGSIQEMPLRNGCTRGDIVIDLGELKVTRTFKSAGASTLKVEMSDGTPVTSPQAVLDALAGKLSFDPLEFARMAPKDQLKTLRELVGLDFTALDADRAKLYAERTQVNRQLDQQKARVQTMKHHPDAPAEEVKVKDLFAAQSLVRDFNTINEAKRKAHDELARIWQESKATHNSALADVERIKELLENAKTHAQVTGFAMDNNSDKVIESSAVIAALEDKDESPIIAEITAADDTNAKVRENAARISATKLVTSLETNERDLTSQIESIDAQKQQLLSEAKFPLEGLSFNDAGVTYQGVPFVQAGTAVKMLTSMKIAHALNPKMPVILIRDASLIHGTNMDTLTAFAKEHDLQVWLELLGDGKNVSFVIEDGNIRES